MTLVDTNILLDIVTRDPVWLEWSVRALETASMRGPTMINDIVYAEMSVRFERIEEVDDFIDDASLKMSALPRAALFLAGKVFQSYRARGGNRSGVLPDFFIGAHAAVSGFHVLTRDVRRYRTYFPKLRLISPQT